MPQYVQAWRIRSSEPVALVYDQKIALRKWGEAEGEATMETLTIVRHEDGSREYLEGCIAAAVKAYREGA